MSADDPFYSPNHQPAPPRQPKPGEHLFDFVRTSDRAPMSCELRFHGESYGWEVQFFERGEFFGGRGAFPTKRLAIQFAEEERRAFERATRSPMETITVEQRWHQEAFAAVDGAEWRCLSAHIAAGSADSVALYQHDETGERRTISLSRDRFPTPEERLDEIHLQLGIGTTSD